MCSRLTCTGARGGSSSSSPATSSSKSASSAPGAGVAFGATIEEVTSVCPAVTIPLVGDDAGDGLFLVLDSLTRRSTLPGSKAVKSFKRS